jgi:hypothetical protein
MTPEEKDTALFTGLVMMFHSAALQNLGKIKNPATDKVEKNLEQAQAMIDMLEMLSKKTRGNTTDEERKFLSNVLQELKLNYVDEVTKQQTETRE